MDDDTPAAPPPPATGDPQVDEALLAVASSDDPQALARALDVLQGVLDHEQQPG